MKKQILFVDDDPFILAGLKRLLRAFRDEWTVHFASGGEEALRLMEQQEFDAIVTDMRMPGMNGAKLLDEVRTRYPATLRIVLSGQSDHGLELETVAAHHILSKPSDCETLKATIEQTSHRSVHDYLHSDYGQGVVNDLSHLGIKMEADAPTIAASNGERHLASRYGRWRRETGVVVGAACVDR